MAPRNYSNVAVNTTLSSGIGASDSSLIVASASGWPAAPFLLVIEPDTANEEIILVGNKSGTTFSSLTRGFGGTSGLAHNAGVEIKHVTVAEDHSLIWAHQHEGAGGDETAQVPHDNLSTVTADQHHAEDHAARHASGGADALSHDVLGGVSTDDHHPQDHAATHLPAGGDPVLHAAHHADGAADAITVVEAQIVDLDHTDDSAIHDDVPSEFSALPAVSPAAADSLIIEDVSDANNKKQVAVSAIGDVLGAVQSWTPVLSDGHSVGAGGVLTGNYLKIGNLVMARMRWLLGSGFTVASGGTISLPVPASTTNIDLSQQSFPLGDAIFRQAGSSAFGGYAIIISSTKWMAKTWDQLHGSNRPRLISIHGSNPHNWQAGDTVEGVLTYQSASP